MLFPRLLSPSMPFQRDKWAVVGRGGERHEYSALLTEVPCTSRNFSLDPTLKLGWIEKCAYDDENMENTENCINCWLKFSGHSMLIQGSYTVLVCKQSNNYTKKILLQSVQHLWKYGCLRDPYHMSTQQIWTDLNVIHYPQKSLKLLILKEGKARSKKHSWHLWQTSVASLLC